MADWKKEFFTRIQSDFPVSLNPYYELANEFGVTESEILDEIRHLKKQGIIRRIGATIDSRKVGYVSTLVACKTSKGAIENAAEEIGKHPGVTHSYERESEYNLWFTLISKSQSAMNDDLEKFRQIPGMLELHALPAEKMYKIKVQFKQD